MPVSLFQHEFPSQKLLSLCRKDIKMNKKFYPVLLIGAVLALLLAGFLFKQKINGLVSEQMKKQAGTEVVLSGEAWVDSLFNYQNNGKNFSYTLLEFSTDRCTVCKLMKTELEKIQNNRSDINVVYLNTMNPNTQNVMQYFGISVTPTQLVLDKKGAELFRNYGFIAADGLTAKAAER